MHIHDGCDIPGLADSKKLSEKKRTALREVVVASAHFGLGEHGGTIDLITIAWPSGIVQMLADAAVGARTTVVEPQP